MNKYTIIPVYCKYVQLPNREPDIPAKFRPRCGVRVNLKFVYSLAASILVPISKPNIGYLCRIKLEYDFLFSEF